MKLLLAACVLVSMAPLTGFAQANDYVFYTHGPGNLTVSVSGLAAVKMYNQMNGPAQEFDMGDGFAFVTETRSSPAAVCTISKNVLLQQDEAAMAAACEEAAAICSCTAEYVKTN